ncbi:uncharacterized protein P174DRAFT_441520 [Aspergillus novofumigatus IBT 16806]|uniref:Uncharacterized protein n=1 Tax=Aspergillus novofumigatus (strain IBT 16806) TaxID=1392255 RepID=A0A2I1C9G7_ASPN1|nr:uncharacterized protein P174DRAFT_441520 [Aspergillus novofumigatus IBT 16806]PKX94236.1 hypothetical protein P174DRAFT_441520 [Aspergillus novofumigatus IBT 16806]
MPPSSSKRRQGSSPVSPRKSRRLARLAPEDAGEGPSSSSKHARARKSNRQQSEHSHSLSANATEPGLPETIDAARERVNCYVKKKRLHEKHLVACLNACLDWLPGTGPSSMAKDIVNAENDEKLWEVYHNVLTGVLYPSKDNT